MSDIDEDIYEDEFDNDDDEQINSPLKKSDKKTN